MCTDVAPCWQMKRGMSEPLSPTPMVTTRCPAKTSKPRISLEWMILPENAPEPSKLGRTGFVCVPVVSTSRLAYSTKHLLPNVPPFCRTVTFQ